MKRAILAAVSLLVVGCPGPQVTDVAPGLDEARALLNSGKLAEGLLEMSRLLAGVSTRTDWLGHQARARILGSSFEAGAVEFLPKVAEVSRDRFRDLAAFAPDRATMITAITESWIGVLSGSSTSEAQLEAARGLADGLRRKLEHPELRQINKELINCPSAEEMYRRLMLETLVECERYLVGRIGPGKPRDAARLATALDQLSASYGTLSRMEEIDAGVRAAWKAASERCTGEAATVRRDPGTVEAVAETRRLVEADARTQVEDAGAYAERANQEMTRRSSRDRIIAQIDESLRRYLLLIETQTGRTFPVTTVYDAVAIWCDRWKANALKKS